MQCLQLIGQLISESEEAQGQLCSLLLLKTGICT